MYRTGKSFLIFVFLMFGSVTLFAADHKAQSNDYGTSGGNVNNETRAFCCSGTLGSLLSAGGLNYILSNNHVLARVDQAVSGEDVSQPGSIDTNCNPQRIVADFSGAAPLGSNVDAAVAQLRSGTMNTTGSILDLGIPSKNIAAPTVGMAVTKAGRTSGVTTGTIGSVNTSVNVQYQKNCNAGKKFVVSYTNQVVINSSSFSAGGDSGSLILTNSNASCRHPVALLYAGSSSTTIGNPIGEVLTKVGSATGRSYSFVGSNCTNSPSTVAASQSAAFEHANNVKNGFEKELMAQASVIGVGVGALDKAGTKPAIVIYMDKTSGVRAKLPRSIDGVPVKIVSTEPFVAF